MMVEQNKTFFAWTVFMSFWMILSLVPGVDAATAVMVLSQCVPR